MAARKHDQQHDQHGNGHVAPEALSANGTATRGKKVRVAIVGVGNCASSLVQGVQKYREAPEDEFVPGLMLVNLCGYHVGDVEFSAAFDVDADKVGKDLSEAIFSGQNNTYKFADVPKLGLKVDRGMTHDGLGQYLSQVIQKAPGSTSDIPRILRDTGTDVVVNYLPVGSEMATKWYVEQVLEAGCAFVNCIPVFIASQPYWQKRFEDRGLPVIGDDIKSQVVLHPAGGHHLRQRAAAVRGQAGGVGLAQLRGGRDRRGPVRPAGPGPGR